MIRLWKGAPIEGTLATKPANHWSECRARPFVPAEQRGATAICFPLAEGARKVQDIQITAGRAVHRRGGIIGA